MEVSNFFKNYNYNIYNYSMDTKSFLKQLSLELHKPVKNKFKRKRVIVHNAFDTFAIDLADMNAYTEYNDEHRYMITCIDIFSRFAWAVPIKTKDSETVLEAFKKILKSSRKHPKKIHADDGSEWKSVFSDFLKQKNITMYHTYSQFHAPMIERFHRTLKQKINMYFTENNTFTYYKVLPKLLKEYNETLHSSIKMKPIDAIKAKNHDEVYKNQYGEMNDSKIEPPKYDIGDNVRISRVKGTFEKDGYNWSMEIFKIVGINYGNPVTYLIQDSNDEILQGSFYEQELQKTKLNDIFLIDKILKKNKNKYFVSWLGYPERFNSWIDKKNVQEI